jgi:glucose/arabinose dehydrogenase
MKKFYVFLLALTACGGSGSGNGGNNGGGQPPPPGPNPPTAVQTQQVFAGVDLSAVTALRQAPGDASRWFAIEQSGIVTVFDNDSVNATDATFLDITGRVQFGGEAGLLGIAFHPDFVTNGQVFISYTTPGPLTSVISRFRSFDGNLTLDPASEEIILTVLQEQSNHNGGDIHFGPDGYLYIALGDGGGGGDPNGNGQNTMSLLGSMLRVDVDVPMGYDIPATNPFSGNAYCVQGSGAAACPEIFAWGFRNPWRFSFDSMTGALWTGDVGQGDFEEVDRVEVGENYGWNTREGAHCYPPGSACDATGLTDPITEYGRGLGVSITGGYVYRGTAMPDLVGYYVFGDFGSGRIFAVAADSPNGTAPIELANTGISISAFAEDVDGELYVVDYGGSVHQIVP